MFLSLPLWKQVPKGAAFGLYSGKGVMNSVRVTFSNKKSVACETINIIIELQGMREWGGGKHG